MEKIPFMTRNIYMKKFKFNDQRDFKMIESLKVYH